MAIQLPESLRVQFDKLDDKKKQYLLYAVIVGAFALVVWMFSDEPTTTTRVQKAAPPVSDILTDSNTRQLGLDSIGSRTIKLETEANLLRTEINSLRSALAARESQQVVELRANEEAIAARIRTDILREVDERNAEAALQKTPDLFALPPQAAAPSLPPQPPQLDENGVPIPTPPPGVAPASAPAAGGIRVIKPAAPPPTAVPVSLNGAPEGELPAKPTTFVPAGSIITGHLLTGIDAPTHKAARSEPYPVSIRVTMESILPSLRRYDLSECFIIAGGFGDLSSERALFRTDLITCIGGDGETVETPIKGFVVGEDGKNGLRGRLVSKQGALIARSLAAGFAEGFSEVFRQAQVPVIANTNAGGSAQFQSLISSGSLQSAGAAGIGSALDRLSQYYLDLANEMHAIIEIDAARQVEVVLLEGVSFPDLHYDAQ